MWSPASYAASSSYLDFSNKSIYGRRENRERSPSIRTVGILSLPAWSVMSTAYRPSEEFEMRKAIVSDIEAITRLV